MAIERDRHLNQLIAKKKDGLIKIITGIRRCGKSYLQNILFRQHFVDSGVDNLDIVILALDEYINAKYRNLIEVGNYIREICADKSHFFYVVLDEIPKVGNILNLYLSDNSEEKIGLVDVLFCLKKLPKVDLHVIGSHSKMLSIDI